MAPTRTRLRSRARSSSGTGTRRSTATKPNPAADGHTEASKRRYRHPSPVAALAHGQYEGRERQRHQHRACVVDRAGTVRIARFGHCEKGQHHADHCDSCVNPEQALPSCDVHQDATDQRSRGCADGCRRTPERHRPELRLASVGHRKQAEPASQDRRACCTFDHAAQRSPHHRCWTARSTRRRRRTAPGRAGRPASDRTRRPAVTITAAPTSE